MVVKDHQYGEKIHSIHFHHATRHVISADTKIVKVWGQNDGSPFTAIEPEGDINELTVLKGSGMMVMAMEEPRLQVYYTPSLGQCSTQLFLYIFGAFGARNASRFAPLTIPQVQTTPTSAPEIPHIQC